MGYLAGGIFMKKRLKQSVALLMSACMLTACIGCSDDKDTAKKEDSTKASVPVEEETKTVVNANHAKPIQMENLDYNFWNFSNF